MKIKLCKYSDLKRISFLEQEAGRRYSEIIADFKEPFMPYSEFVQAYNEGVKYFGAVVDNEITGFIGYRNKVATALVRGLFVLPEYQRKGIGETLLRSLEESARKDSVKELMLLAHKQAHWAVSFYEKHGFYEISQNMNILLEKYWAPLPEGLQCAANDNIMKIMRKSMI